MRGSVCLAQTRGGCCAFSRCSAPWSADLQGGAGGSASQWFHDGSLLNTSCSAECSDARDTLSAFSSVWAPHLLPASAASCSIGGALRARVALTDGHHTGDLWPSLSGWRDTSLTERAKGAAPACLPACLVSAHSSHSARSRQRRPAGLHGRPPTTAIQRMDTADGRASGCAVARPCSRRQHSSSLQSLAAAASSSSPCIVRADSARSVSSCACCAVRRGCLAAVQPPDGHCPDGPDGCPVDSKVARGGEPRGPVRCDRT